jgi:hypothetical protein
MENRMKHLTACTLPPTEQGALSPVETLTRYTSYLSAITVAAAVEAWAPTTVATMHTTHRRPQFIDSLRPMVETAQEVTRRLHAPQAGNEVVLAELGKYGATILTSEALSTMGLRHYIWAGSNGSGVALSTVPAECDQQPADLILFGNGMQHAAAPDTGVALSSITNRLRHANHMYANLQEYGRSLVLAHAAQHWGHTVPLHEATLKPLALYEEQLGRALLERPLTTSESATAHPTTVQAFA